MLSKFLFICLGEILIALIVLLGGYKTRSHKRAVSKIGIYPIVARLVVNHIFRECHIVYSLQGW